MLVANWVQFRASAKVCMNCTSAMQRQTAQRAASTQGVRVANPTRSRAVANKSTIRSAQDRTLKTRKLAVPRTASIRSMRVARRVRPHAARMGNKIENRICQAHEISRPTSSQLCSEEKNYPAQPRFQDSPSTQKNAHTTSVSATKSKITLSSACCTPAKIQNDLQRLSHDSERESRQPVPSAQQSLTTSFPSPRNPEPHLHSASSPSPTHAAFSVHTSGNSSRHAFVVHPTPPLIPFSRCEDVPDTRIHSLDLQPRQTRILGAPTPPIIPFSRWEDVPDTKIRILIDMQTCIFGAHTTHLPLSSCQHRAPKEKNQCIMTRQQHSNTTLAQAALTWPHFHGGCILPHQCGQANAHPRHSMTFHEIHFSRHEELLATSRKWSSKCWNAFWAETCPLFVKKNAPSVESQAIMTKLPSNTEEMYTVHL